MSIVAGKLYEYAGKGNAILFDETATVIAQIRISETFVVIEYLGRRSTKNHIRIPSCDSYDDLHCVKILTSNGVIGQAAFWLDELQLAKTS